MYPPLFLNTLFQYQKVHSKRFSACISGNIIRKTNSLVGSDPIKPLNPLLHAINTPDFSFFKSLI
jgi:hypothetical protein